MSGDDVQQVKVGEFMWADLAGNGRYRLVVTADTTGRSFFDRLDVYQRDDQSGVRVQSILGSGIRDLPRVIKDLNEDGRKELVVPSILDAQGPGSPLAPTVVWPKVYRLRNGKYVDASAEFPGFYDKEVLPGLDKEIGEAQQRVSGQSANIPAAGDPYFVQHDAEARYPQRKLAALEMTKDKILRVLGRDRAAGLERAREWMTNADSYLVGNAVTVLRDMGGHKDDLRAAEEALKVAVERERGTTH
jgi:hypothetical protein